MQASEKKRNEFNAERSQLKAALGARSADNIPPSVIDLNAFEYVVILNA